MTQVQGIQKVGVIGAGQMGRGIAQVFAQSGYDVIMQDVSPDALTEGLSFIMELLDRAVDKGKLQPQERDATIARLAVSDDIAHLGSCDLVIESATEKEEIKISIFRELVPHLAEHTLLATNTSSISITRLAATTDRPERFMGLHFMNPVPVMKLVELIRGIATDRTTFEAMSAVVESLNKTGAVSEDYPAFIVNRVLVPMINEAAYALFEGVGSITSIDNSMKLGANHPMGPFELADFIGLDTCLSIMNVVNAGMADTKYRPCPLLVKYVEAGWLGRKTGKDLYNYKTEDGTPVPTR